VTGNLLLDLVISAAGVGLLVALSYVLGGYRDAVLNEASMRDRLAFDEPDFAVSDFLISTDGKAAIALDTAKREGAVVFAHGDGLATRRFPIGSAAVGSDGAALVISLHDVSKWRVRIAAAAPDAAKSWARRLGG
jgi:hypothetical protein